MAIDLKARADELAREAWGYLPVCAHMDGSQCAACSRLHAIAAAIRAGMREALEASMTAARYYNPSRDAYDDGREDAAECIDFLLIPLEEGKP